MMFPYNARLHASLNTYTYVPLQPLSFSSDFMRNDDDNHNEDSFSFWEIPTYISFSSLVSDKVMDLIKKTFDGSFYTRIFVPEQDEGSLA